MAPIVGASLAYLGSEQWEISTYVVQLSIIVFNWCFSCVIFVKRRPAEEGTTDC